MRSFATWQDVETFELKSQWFSCLRCDSCLLFDSVLMRLVIYSLYTCQPTGPQGSGVSSSRRGVDQRKRSDEVTEIALAAERIYEGLVKARFDTCHHSSPAEHRPRTSSTASSGVCSGRTTTPPTSRAASHASPTSTWPPSAACSTTTYSTPSSLAAPRCSTSPPSGPSTAMLAWASPSSSTGPKAVRRHTKPPN